jgi:hypothetical protein
LKNELQASKHTLLIVFFRGGYTELNEPRTGQVLSDLETSANTDNNGWYIGSGLDFLVNENVWELWNGASVLAELGLKYKVLVEELNLQCSQC